MQKKAAVETVGYMIDAGMAVNFDFTYDNFFILSISHLLCNYGVRKTTKLLNQKGFSFDSVANNCDILPEAVKPIVNPVVRFFVEGVTHPEMLTYLYLTRLLLLMCSFEEK